MRQDLTSMQQWIAPHSRVLDLGCGDGEFLSLLTRERNIRGLGLEIDQDNIASAVAKGLNVVEQNMDLGLDNFRDNSFDTVVMALALQAVHFPDQVLSQMLRIGQEGIVTFPNFAHWRCRLHLSTRGRMPVSKFMPYSSSKRCRALAIARIRISGRVTAKSRCRPDGKDTINSRCGYTAVSHHTNSHT